MNEEQILNDIVEVFRKHSFQEIEKEYKRKLEYLERKYEVASYKKLTEINETLNFHIIDLELQIKVKNNLIVEMKEQLELKDEKIYNLQMELKNKL